MLDLVRLSPKRLFPPGGPDLYRQISLLTDLNPDREILVVACGKGVTLEYFVREQGATGTGVDSDPRLIDQAENFARDEGLAGRMSFQVAASDDLPFRDESFDVGVGELGLAAEVDPGDAIRELVRVVRPGGQVVLIQLVWKAPVEETRKPILSAHLGARPLMLVESRRILMEAGVGGIHTEDWTNEETAFRPQVKKPFPDFAELFSLPEKFGILRRAWSRWGWKGVWTVFQREIEVHRLLTRERILALNLLKGVKAPLPESGSVEEIVPGPADKAEAPGVGLNQVEVPVREEPPEEGRGKGGVEKKSQTAGLPLFGSNGEPGQTPG
ncbi:class I SAM-dependent methyltransferase [Gemmatimonadota bacterium]